MNGGRRPSEAGGPSRRPATWLVTGGSRGIGRAIVLHAAARGANVVLCAHRSHAAADAVAREAEQLGARALAVTADVRCEAAVRDLFDAARAAFGAVDVVVCNAGASRHRLLVNTSPADWGAMMDTNLTGAFLTAREALRTFRATGRPGHIVLIGSLMQHGASSHAVYAASKGGLVGLLTALAHRSGVPGTRAALATVGYVDTELSRELASEARQRIVDHCPMRRPANDAEIAEAVWFLAGEGAVAFDGRALHVAGGMREVPQ